MPAHTPIMKNGVDIADPNIIRDDDVRDLEIITRPGATLDTARLLAKLYPDAYGLSGKLPWRPGWGRNTLWPPCITDKCTRGSYFEFSTRELNPKCKRCLAEDEQRERIDKLTQASINAKI